jgi:hypothetical protein
MTMESFRKMMSEQNGGGKDGGKPSKEDAEMEAKVRGLVTKIMDVMFPSDGKFSNPKGPLYVNGKPTIDISKYDPKLMEIVKKGSDFIEKTKMKPDMSKQRPPYDKEGKPLMDTRGLTEAQVKAGFLLMQRISPDNKPITKSPFNERTGEPNFSVAGLSTQQLTDA